MAATVHAALWLGSLLPHAESPWPTHIGIGFPFTLAGACGFFRTFAISYRSVEERDRASSAWSRGGFWTGFAFYMLLLLAQ